MRKECSDPMGEKRVKDLMLPLSEYATISGERTIQDALKALDKVQLGLTYDQHHNRAVLVLGVDGEVVGKLSHLSILRKLEPKFLNTNDLSALSRANLSADYISNLEESITGFSVSLSTLCKRSSGIKAKDAMVHVGESIDENESLVVAIHQLVVRHVQSLLVRRESKTVGILRLSDVFEEVADIIRNNGEG